MSECVSCGGIFIASLRGRPGIRCFSCSPENRLPPGSYARPRRHMTCPFCSAVFLSDHGLQVFCSAKCGVTARNLAKQISARDRSARPCASCGTSFAPAYGDLRWKYCSDECVRRTHNARTSGKPHERRARIFGGAVERVDKLRVFARDGWRCRICNIETSRALMGSKDGRAPELDHVFPLSRGGDHSYANTQTACRSCNQLKRDLTVGELLAKLAA